MKMRKDDDKGERLLRFARATRGTLLADKGCASSGGPAATPPATEDADAQGQGQSDPNVQEHQSPRIFGVPLQESIRYANVAISLTDGEGKSFIYGYVPIVVAKCGVFLKEKGRFIIAIDVQAFLFMRLLGLILIF